MAWMSHDSKWRAGPPKARAQSSWWRQQQQQQQQQKREWLACKSCTGVWVYRDQGHHTCKFCGESFDQWAAPASDEAAAVEPELELHELLTKLGISAASILAGQLRETLVKKHEEAAAAAEAANPQQCRKPRSARQL